VGNQLAQARGSKGKQTKEISIMSYGDDPLMGSRIGNTKKRWTFMRIATLVFLGVIVLVLLIAGWGIFDTNKAGYMIVKQAAIKGDLTCRLEPGTFGQFWGDLHTYSEAETFFFTADEQTGEHTNQSLPTRFNDGAKAQVSGSLRVILPRDCDELVHLHRKFHSMNGVMNKLVLPAVRKTLFSTGPHMSAGESYAERRGEFAALAEDQLRYGVILVDKHLEMRPDPITTEMREVYVLEKMECQPGDRGATAENCIGGFFRDPSAFAEFGVSVTNFVIDNIEYCPDGEDNCPVMQQIEAQRTARMDIITQQAEAAQANARASKAEAEARAKIAETRATEEVAKTQLIVRGEAAREQARLAQEAATFYRQEQILRGQGEAERKRLVMSADGALQQKLDTYEKVQQHWAEAFAQRAVPTTVFGAGGVGSTDTQTTEFQQTLQMLLAGQMGLDLSIPKGANRGGGE
jgi:regulator of protease activity HflC (stomatin/prohibitin superfamily)